MLHHIAIGTKYPEKLSNFYRQLPCMRFLQEHYNADNSLRSVWLEIVNSCIFMIEKKETKCFPEALVFSIYDANRKLYKLDFLKERFLKKTDYTLYFFDPDENQFGFSSYPNKLELGILL